MTNKNFGSYKEKYEYLVKALKENSKDSITKIIIDTVEQGRVESTPRISKNTATKEEIMKLKDPVKRQKLIRENTNLFTKGEK